MGALAAAAVTGGSTAIAAVLAIAFAVQVTPAVWSVYRTASPTGVARVTWVLVGVESLLWGAYGLGHGDPANISFGVVGALAAVAILARTGPLSARRARGANMSPCPT